MGQFISWLRGTQESSGLEDVTIEEQSQPKQPTSTPSVPASTVKPAQYEKEATSSVSAGVAAKPATTTASAVKTTASTHSTSTESTKAASSVTNVGASTGAKVSGGVTTTTGASKATTTAGSSKVTTQSTTVSSSKPEPSKVTSTVTKPTATTVVSASTGQKVKSEVSAKASTTAPDVDPFDTLAGTLPSANPPKSPQFTGPEVTEPNLTSVVAPRCGDRDDTLPPGYRLKDMEKKMPAAQPEKPKEVSKPLTLDEAVDSLSAGFVSSSKPEIKHETVAAVQTQKSHAPAPPSQKKQDVSVPASLSPAPPADKKPKIEKPTTAAAQDVKPKSEEKKVSVDKPQQVPKADSMSLDALDALGDMLPEAKPVPESPKLRPDQIVDEKKLVSEKGVRVGERDDTLPPEYRFKEDKDKKPAPPPKQPSMDTTQALDLLSGDFTDATVAPAVHTPVPPKAQAKKPQLEDLSALDALEGDFVAPTQAKKVSSGVLPVPTPATKSTTSPSNQADSGMSLEALDALGETLPEAKPVPESPKLRPDQIVKEANLTSEKGVRVGERDDTLPPDYRFPKDDKKTQPPPPKKEPSLDPADALDILSGDFSCSAAAAPVVQTSVSKSTPRTDSSADFALEELAGDFVAPTSASKVCSSAASAPTSTDKQPDSGMSLEALDALGETLPEAKQVPESPKLRPDQIVKEANVTSEKGVFVGERDDTLPPDYRFPKDDNKTQPPPPKKEPSLDPADALDILSGDFSCSVAAPVVQTPAQSSADFDLEELAGDFVAPKTASKVCSAASAPAVDRQLSEGTASAMDALSDTLKDISPAPEPAPVPLKDIVKEKKVVEERVHKTGERDDSLPPEYRPTEADIKAAAEAKAKAASAAKQNSLDDAQALDLLSGDFVSGPVTPPTVQCQASPVKTSSSQKESGPVLDKLAATLLPEDFPHTKPSDSKPKKPAAAAAAAAAVPETLPGKPSRDVVSSSPAKKGGKS
ncbi:calpastatin isoform X3 [Silurus meridionalis]|uniref:calpastatin isoform X3 n=1 Tax=Silurus meridionalis TaxID=175797 RepID=UPI001EECDB88|nr:calpastatin isoform X3 [Silurus meridionalis]